ncbi:MAG: LamG-like jellyroll fold domain-containing protein [Spirochaetota bacterium]
MYVDGSQIGAGYSFTVGDLVVDAGGFIIGQEQDSVGGGFQPGQSWASDIDSLRVYDRPLSSEEISALYLAGRGL